MFEILQSPVGPPQPHELFLYRIWLTLNMAQAPLGEHVKSLYNERHTIITQ